MYIASVDHLPPVGCAGAIMASMCLARFRRGKNLVATVGGIGSITGVDGVPARGRRRVPRDRPDGLHRAAQVDERVELVLLGVVAEVVEHLAVGGEGLDVFRERKPQEGHRLLRQVRHQAAVWTK